MAAITKQETMAATRVWGQIGLFLGIVLLLCVAHLPGKDPTTPVQATPVRHESAGHAGSERLDTELIEAAGRGDAAAVQQLLQKGAHTEARDEYAATVLMLAAHYCDADAVKLLLDKGANVEARDKYGSTALLLAAEQGKTDVVKLLLDKGANIEARNQYSSTPLLRATFGGYPEAMKLLLAKGANIEAEDKGGRTVLFVAVQGRNAQIVKLLLDRGAKLDAHTVEPPLLWAARENMPDIEKLLLDQGAKPEVVGADGGKRGDELPKELARRESRLEKIREAKAALEQEAKEAAEKKQAEVEAQLQEREKQERARGRKFGGRPPQAPDPQAAKPQPQAQRNFTDPESRIMKDGATKEFVQAYNAQAAVDSHAQVIVGAAVTQEGNDKKQLVPMLREVKVQMGIPPQRATADNGYFSEPNVTDAQLQEIDLFVAPDRQKHSEKPPVTTGPPPSGASMAEQMRHKLRTAEGQAVYKLRKAVVEPVFGQIKEARGFRRFLLRGLANVQAEWQMICATHNLLKLFRSEWSPQRA